MDAASPDESPESFKKRAVLALKDRIPHDAYVWGAGSRQADGSVHIIRSLSSASHLPERFLAQYEKVAAGDVVGILFAAFPRLTFRVSRADYKALARTRDEAAELHDYLREAGICHLMLAGTETRQGGLAWITFYRRQLDKTQPDEPDPFSASEEEEARYLVPYYLHEWLRLLPQAVHPRASDYAAEEVPQPAALLRMTPEEAGVAVLLAHQLPAKVIAKILGTTPGKVYEAHKTYFRRTGLARPLDLLVLARLLGPPPRTSHPRKSG